MSLKDEISENWKNFKEPVTHAIENTKVSIEDRIEDAKSEDEEVKIGLLYSLPVCILMVFIYFPLAVLLFVGRLVKKGIISSKTRFIIDAIVIVLIIYSFIQPSNTEPSDNSTVDSSQQTTVQDTTDLPDTSTDLTPEPIDESESTITMQTGEWTLTCMQAQDSWAEQNNIPLADFTQNRLELDAWLSENRETLGQNLIYVKPDNILGENQYKITSERSEYLYCGGIKDNYASGFGILFALSDTGYNILSDEYGYDLSYMGEFSDGRFDGYGLKFNCSESNSDALHILESICPDGMSNSNFPAYYIRWVNYVTYEGEF